MGMRVREQKHICGESYSTAPYLEADIFEITEAQHKASARAKKELATSLVKDKHNQEAAKRYLVQLINTNFGPGDWSITQTYTDENLPAAGDLALEPVHSVTRLQGMGMPPSSHTPVKDIWYMTRRYFDFDHYRYDVWCATERGKLLAYLVTRTAEVTLSDGSQVKVLRMVDFIGEDAVLARLGTALDRILAESGAEYLTKETLPEGFELLPLPGHFFDMAGFRTPDDNVYLADCLSSRETLEKYQIGFIYDVAAYLNTLEKVKTLKARLFVPAHAEAAEDITELAQYNIDKVNEIADKIVSLCKEPLGFEVILQRLFTEYGLVMNFEQYVLVGSTVRSYLAWLKDTGRLNAVFEKNLLLWEKI